MNSKKDKNTQVSHSFCAAKWLQVTIYLQNGVNHSCHHPNTHRIPLQELKKDLSVFHNTAFKKEQRKMMLEGVRPPECVYCWNIEDKVGQEYSDRKIKNEDSWAVDKIEKLKSSDPSENINPSYLEVSLGSECNFACSYCKADSSTRIENELKQFGDYETYNDYGKTAWLKSDGRLPVYNSDENPYRELFREWFKEIKEDLRVFRMTGGEPFINPLFSELVEELKNRKNPGLEVSVNSNLGMAHNIVVKQTAKLKELEDKEEIDKVAIYTSLESFGPQAEYVRFGLDMELFKKNTEYILENTNFQLVFMATHNILSIFSFKEMMDYILGLKKKYEKDHNDGQRIIIDSSYLSSPQYMSVRFANKEMVETMKENLDYMESNSIENLKTHGFSKYEINKYKRIYHYAKTANVDEESPETIKCRHDFVTFFNEYDRRKGISLLKTFPELKAYYHYCRLVKMDIEYRLDGAKY